MSCTMKTVHLGLSAATNWGVFWQKKGLAKTAMSTGERLPMSPALTRATRPVEVARDASISAPP